MYASLGVGYLVVLYRQTLSLSLKEAFGGFFYLFIYFLLLKNRFLTPCTH